MAVALGNMTGRLLAVNSVDKVRIDLGANPGLLQVLNTTAGRHASGEVQVA